MSFNQLPLDIVKYIILPLPYECLCNFFCVSRLTISIANDANFWKAKLQLEYHLPKTIISNYRAYYELLLSQDMDRYTLDLLEDNVTDLKEEMLKQQLQQHLEQIHESLAAEDVNRQFINNSIAEMRLACKEGKNCGKNRKITVKLNRKRASKVLYRARKQFTITYQPKYIEIKNTDKDLYDKIDNELCSNNSVCRLEKFLQSYDISQIDLTWGSLIHFIGDDIDPFLIYIFNNNNRLYAEISTTRYKNFTVTTLPRGLKLEFVIDNKLNTTRLRKAYPQLKFKFG